MTCLCVKMQRVYIYIYIYIYILFITLRFFFRPSQKYNTLTRRISFLVMGHIIVTWFNSTPSMDTSSLPLQRVGWDYWSIPTPKLYGSLELDKSLHPTLNWACHYLSTRGWKLIPVSKRGPRKEQHFCYIRQHNHTINCLCHGDKASRADFIDTAVSRYSSFQYTGFRSVGV